ncbi:APC family permease [Kribbella solani]|uniref:APC family permease n=1 Tax=Kribbella solani TaxID=236067 RepID=UPI0029BB65CF|nr:APC family permease [Kribbella solani]MDX2970136.1 APC family permease [Kribbella solani]MDX3004235.1 APC family permease [Kribbella solani]
MTATGQQGNETAATGERTDELQKGVLGIGGVMMQNIANIAPAIAALFTVQNIASYAGISTPIAYVLAFLVTLCLGSVLGQLVKKLPSAGSYYTYISRTIGPNVGFVMSWVYFLAFPLVGAQVATSTGTTVEQDLLARYGFHLPWWVFTLVALTITAAVTYVGIAAGIKALFVASAIEMVIVGALAVSGLISPGDGGFSMQGFNPAHLSDHPTFYLGVVFAIFALTGWDAAAPLAEESARPRRTVSKGIIYSILLMGAFLVLTSWGLQVGWGTEHADSFVSSTDNPAFVLAHRLWRGGSVLVLIALVNSAIAVLISSMNASTRMWYRMARVGVLPRGLGRVHPRFKTPSTAILVQTALSFVLAFALSAAWGVENVFSVLGFLFMFAAIPVWSVANLAVFVLYRREHRDEFNIVLHALVPIVGTVGLIWFAYKSLVPYPTYPDNAAIPIVIAWTAIAIGIVIYLRLRGKGNMLHENAGRAFDESAPVEAEVAS